MGEQGTQEKNWAINYLQLDAGHLPADFPCNPLAWLRQLEGPTWIDIAGRDSQRTRVIATLLHGNEPSGVQALYHWLQEKQIPATNVSIFIGAVDVALTEPLFTHRMLPGQRDLNRCFRPPFDGRQGQLAQEVLARIEHLQPECMVDIHNTSGSGPSFSVTVSRHPVSDLITRMFCRRMIVTDFRLGSLMEIDVGCPTVTIECGGAQDEEAVRVGRQGLERLLTASSLDEELDPDEAIEVMVHPLRVELRNGISIAYSDHPLEEVDVTLSADLEFRNHGITTTDTCLGWVGSQGLSMLEAISAAGEDCLGDLFRERQGWLYPVEDLRLFMVTTDAAIARSDCLFYAVPA